MNILILTGKFGMGHWTASQSLRQQLLRRFPDASAEVVDFPAYAMPKLSRAFYKSFDLIVSHGSSFFNAYYKFTARRQPDVSPPFEESFLDCLAELLRERRADVVIATHPLCAQLMSRLREKTRLKNKAGLDLPLITCVTDISSHPEWINQNTDCYLVPAREIRQRLVAGGVDPSLVCVTGIPVREEFRNLSHHDTGERMHLLIMGGGLGLLPKAPGFYDVVNEIPNTDTTVITGRNQKLFEQLRGRWKHIQVLGYTDRVWEYMSRADLLVTKPGGITLFEAIFAQCPILCQPPSLEQERGNAEWMVRAGIGWVAEQRSCAGKIQELLSDRQRLSDASARMGVLREQLETGILERRMERIAKETTAKETEKETEAAA